MRVVFVVGVRLPAGQYPEAFSKKRPFDTTQIRLGAVKQYPLNY